MHSVHFTDPHCLTISPPLSMTAAWWPGATAAETITVTIWSWGWSWRWRGRSWPRHVMAETGHRHSASSPPTLIRLLNNVTFLAIIPLPLCRFYSSRYLDIFRWKLDTNIFKRLESRSWWGWGRLVGNMKGIWKLLATAKQEVMPSNKALRKYKDIHK